MLIELLITPTVSRSFHLSIAIADRLSLCAYPPITDSCMRRVLGLDEEKTTTYGPRRLDDDDGDWATTTEATTSTSTNSTTVDDISTKAPRLPARRTTPRPLFSSSSSISSFSSSISSTPSLDFSIHRRTLPPPRLPLLPPTATAAVNATSSSIWHG